MAENGRNTRDTKAPSAKTRGGKSSDPFDRLRFPENKKKGPAAYADIAKVIRQWLSQDTGD